jgi:hypothetical protein
MKKYAIFLFLATMLFSCGKNREATNYVEINGRSYSLRTAFFEDYGTNLSSDDHLYRDYYIQLQSGYAEDPSPETTLGFDLYSWNAEEIGDGTYYFRTNTIGYFYAIRLGINQRYDNKGEVIKGDFFSTLDTTYSNRIEIHSGKYGKKIFDINLRFISKDGQTYVVIAHYEASINEHIVTHPRPIEY